MSKAIESPGEDISDALLPSQYHDLIRHQSSVINAEYRLLWAILADAIRIYLNPSRSGDFEEVRNWFESRQTKPGSLFAFEIVCDYLGIDARRLLNHLKSLNGCAFSSDPVPDSRPPGFEIENVKRSMRRAGKR
jgi:hypothetical protein